MKKNLHFDVRIFYFSQILTPPPPPKCSVVCIVNIEETFAKLIPEE